MNIIIYISTFIIALFILYLIITDLKKFKLKLYNEINYNIWIKIYALISIGLIHALWLFNELFVESDNNNVISYGIPYYLLFPYSIYVISEIKLRNDYNNNKNISNASEKINRYMNYLVLIYIFFIIIIILIPKEIKETFIKCIKNIIDKYL
jgi:hypothetical protein